MVSQGKEIAIITWQECLEWVRVGQFRNNNRIGKINEYDKQKDFNRLMELAPYVTFEQDQAFVLAFLKTDWFQYSNTISLINSNISLIALNAVEYFSVMSERGFSLLRGEAERSWIALKGPNFEDLWQSWVSAQRKAQSIRRAKAFVEILRLPDADDPPFGDDILPFLIDGGNPPPEPQKLEPHTKSRAYGWSFALQMISHLLGGRAEMDKYADRSRLADILKILKKDNVINSPLIKDVDVIQEANKINKKLNNTYKNTNIIHLAIVCHYRHVIQCTKTLDLASLVTDLVALASNESIQHASNIASIIGQSLDDEFVSTLRFAKSPVDFPALLVRETASWSNLNVDARARTEREDWSHKQHLDCFDLRLPALIVRPDDMSGVGSEETVAPPYEQSNPKTDDGVVNTGCVGGAEGVSPSAPDRVSEFNPVGTPYSSDVEGGQMTLLPAGESVSSAVGSTGPAGGNNEIVAEG